jgi:uncharacterized protein YjdB
MIGVLVSRSRAVLALLLTLAAVVAGCGGGSGTTPTPPPPPPETVASVTVSPANWSMVVGTSVSLSATALSATGAVITGKTPTWTSSNTAVATVATDGLVNAVGPGTSTVTATIDGKSGSATVQVILPLAVSVTVTPASDTLDLNESVTLTATARDGDSNPIAGKPITWSSSNPSVASVSQAGAVTGLTEGTVQITATADAAAGSATITVRVAVASVAVAPASSALLVGGTVQLTATPQSATGAALPGRSVAWQTSNATVATVSATGLVTARAAGSATISATSEGRTGAATVTVTAVPVATVSVEPAAATVQTGGSVQLVATPKDSTGTPLTGRSINWTSGNTGVATVSISGRVTGLTAGQAVITATSEGKSGTATVTVLSSPVASVTLVPTSGAISVGGTLQFTAVLRSAGGDTLTGRTVSWTSKTPGVATVTPSGGLVTAVAPGITTITAQSEGKSATAEVTVTAEPPATVTVLPASSTITAGDILILTAVSRDAGGNLLPGRTATWATYYGFAVTSYTSNDTTVVTGITAGTDTVLAQVDGTSGEARVQVAASATNICAQVSGASVIASDGTFLGILGTATDPQSIYNPYGTYGSQTSAVSIYNPGGQYGSRTSIKSPWNPYATTPPTLVKNSVTLGSFTLNRLLSPRFSPSYPEYCTFP